MLLDPEPPQTGVQGRDIAVGQQYLVAREGHEARPATVLNCRNGKQGREVYIAFVGEDKRLDSWIPESALGDEVAVPGPSRLPLKNGTPLDIGNGRTPASGYDSERSSPDREHEEVTRVRNFEDVRFGEYLIKTWYYSPYPMPAAPDSVRGKKRKDPPGSKPPVSRDQHHQRDVLSHGVGKGGEGARGRLWVCDLCFKYMIRSRAAWEKHISSCTQLQPPGRKVYQRGSYTIWEVDGANAALYCENLSLFGKLFIDHKSVFFHVENFLFYVLCDAVTSRRDQVMAFFSKEKFSYDDYNLACIVTFPPCQNRGFGKLLIEFSYYLTRHPATRSNSGSPGTPERPLSDLGHKGYMAYWVAVILRFCQNMVADAEFSTAKAPASREGRSLRARQAAAEPEEVVLVNGEKLVKRPDRSYKGHYSVVTSLESLARACHLRTDDVLLTLDELGFLRRRRKLPPRPKAVDDEELTAKIDAQELGEWHDVEIVISRDMIEEAWAAWRVRDKPVLDEQYCLL